jgi:predicted ATPase/class 3 adenylate cyclase
MTLPTGIVTFLYTDIQGSTPLWERDPQGMRNALARHNAVLVNVIAAHDGYCYKTVGDAFQAAFADPAQAVAAAVAGQRGLAQAKWGRTGPLLVRMGIHTGPAIAEETDYATTHTLNRVARIMSAAHGEQILLSNEVVELVRHRLPEGISLRDMGKHRMKGLTQLEHLFQVIVPGLPAIFPPLTTLDLSPNNLPIQLTSFVGREKEVTEVKKLLSTSRLVTLTGSGGCGKTRLSVQIASEIQSDYASGVWLAELASVTDPTLVAQTLLSIFKLREDSHRSTLEVLIDYLRTKALLLMLDNCEHLIEACAEISEALLHACPKLRVLASSREALGIAGEVAYRVPSLNTPDPAHIPSLDQLEKLDSIRLFVERAETAKPGFTLTNDNASSLAQICFRLDGIPLAIELAASRVKVLTPEQIASRLDDRFSLLTGGSRTALPRQQTLRAMIDWSYSLLSEQEKILFRRLAVFVSGWTLEAAEAICCEVSGLALSTTTGRDTRSSGFDVLDLLTRLVDKSLIFVEESKDEIRYHRLETIRQYSREKFFETDEVEAMRDRHLDFFAGFAELVDENLKGRDQLVWQNRMSAEQDNVRAALEWGLTRNPDSALRIAGAANLFWTAGGYSAEGFRWTQKALEEVEKIPVPKRITMEQRRLARAKALRGLTRLYLSLGDNANAKRVAEESVALYRQSQDQRGLAFALVVLAYPLELLGERIQAEEVLQESNAIAHAEGDVYVICRSLNLLARVILDLHHDLDLSQGYVEESLRLAKEAGLRSQEAQASEISGLIATYRNDYDDARSHLKESIRVYQEIGAVFNVILEKSNLAHLERKLGNYAEALEYYCETIVAFQDIGQTGAVAHQLECFGFIALAQDQNERALQLFAAANALREKSGMLMTPDEQSYFDEQLKGLREKIDSKGYESIWSIGRAMSVDQAIQTAVQAYHG